MWLSAPVVLSSMSFQCFGMSSQGLSGELPGGSCEPAKRCGSGMEAVWGMKWQLKTLDGPSGFKNMRYRKQSIRCSYCFCAVTQLLKK